MRKRNALEVVWSYCAAIFLIFTLAGFFISMMMFFWLKDRFDAVKNWVRWMRG